MNGVVYCDFSNIYAAEGREDLRLDFSGLEGTNGYCSPEAAIKIRQKISAIHNTVHVLDNGNYHYMSLFWMEQIRERFDLIVFDNHTDMQKSSLIPTLSCGNWILEAINDEQVPLNKVWLIGAPQTAFDEIEHNFGESIEFIAREKIENAGSKGICCLLENLSKSDLPVYISVDKDVLLKDELDTSWDNGSMSLDALEKALRFISAERRVIGLDLCGEPDINKNGFSREFEKSRKIDERLINAVFKTIP